MPKNISQHQYFKDLWNGTPFGKMEDVKLTITHKDLLLILGIVVAIIITITSWLSSSTSSVASIPPSISPKKNVYSMVRKLSYSLVKWKNTLK